MCHVVEQFGFSCASTCTKKKVGHSTQMVRHLFCEQCSLPILTEIYDLERHLCCSCASTPISAVNNTTTSPTMVRRLSTGSTFLHRITSLLSQCTGGTAATSVLTQTNRIVTDTHASTSKRKTLLHQEMRASLFASIALMKYSFPCDCSQLRLEYIPNIQLELMVPTFQHHPLQQCTYFRSFPYNSVETRFYIKELNGLSTLGVTLTREFFEKTLDSRVVHAIQYHLGNTVPELHYKIAKRYMCLVPEKPVQIVKALVQLPHQNSICIFWFGFIRLHSNTVLTIHLRQDMSTIGLVKFREMYSQNLVYRIMESITFVSHRQLLNPYTDKMIVLSSHGLRFEFPFPMHVEYTSISYEKQRASLWGELSSIISINKQKKEVVTTEEDDKPDSIFYIDNERHKIVRTSLHKFDHGTFTFVMEHAFLNYDDELKHRIDHSIRSVDIMSQAETSQYNSIFSKKAVSVLFQCTEAQLFVPYFENCEFFKGYNAMIKLPMLREDLSSSARLIFDFKIRFDTTFIRICELDTTTTEDLECLFECTQGLEFLNFNSNINKPIRAVRKTKQKHQDTKALFDILYLFRNASNTVCAIHIFFTKLAQSDVIGEEVQTAINKYLMVLYPDRNAREFPANLNHIKNRGKFTDMTIATVVSGN